jgi:nucleoid DNA-binding protein
MAEAKTAQAKKDWVEVISKATKVEKASVRKVINATVEALRDEIAKEERVSFPRLGSFIRRPGKEPGESRVVFRPWAPKEPGEGEKKA